MASNDRTLWSKDDLKRNRMPFKDMHEVLVTVMAQQYAPDECVMIDLLRRYESVLCGVISPSNIKMKSLRDAQ